VAQKPWHQAEETHDGDEMNKVLSMIIRVTQEIFNFFCGDWRIFWGMAMTTVLIELIEHLAGFSLLKPFAGCILIVGVSLSLVLALQHEMTGQVPQTSRRKQRDSESFE
jgi:hypothetical protein